MAKIDLQAEAAKAMQKAYSPYSRFKVGAAILTEAGNIYAGCNVENISYGLTICAERNAIVQAVAAEGPGMKLEEVVECPWLASLTYELSEIPWQTVRGGKKTIVPSLSDIYHCSARAL